MSMTKEVVYLTDITFHTRTYRQTINFAKIAQKGRIYSPLPKGYEKNVENKSGTGTFSFSIDLPQDLRERWERGEVEIMMPEGGLLIYAGRDVYDLIEKKRLDKHRADVHSKWGAKAWRDKKEGV